MFKLNNRSKKIMKALSLGIVSLGLLAGVGMASGNSNNAHAMTAEQIFNDPYLKAENAKADAEANAIGAKRAQEVGPSEAKVEQEDTEPGYEPSTGVKISSIKSQQKHVAYPVKKAHNKKSAKHVRKHNKNLARNKKAKRASRRTKRAKKHSYKKAKLVKKSAHHNWRHVRPSKNHLSRLNKNHRKNVKRTHKSQRLTKKQVKHFNSLIKKDKKALKSKKAKKNYKYRKALVKDMKLIKKFLISKK